MTIAYCFRFYLFSFSSIPPKSSISVKKVSGFELFPARESLVSVIPAGDGKTANIFLQRMDAAQGCCVFKDHSIPYSLLISAVYYR